MKTGFPTIAAPQGRGWSKWLAVVVAAWAGPCAAQLPQWVGRLHGFGPDRVWAAYSATSPLVVLTGDVNGDGLDDMILFHRNSPGKEGDVEVRLNTGGEFAAAVRWHDWFCVGDEIPKVGDFNGDGRDDLAAFLRHSVAGQEADVRVTLSLASAPNTFTGNALWHDTFCYHDEIPAVGDVNADGSDDILTLAVNGTTSALYAALSNRSSAFVPSRLWHASLNTLAMSPALHTGRFNADANADVMTSGHGNWPWGGMLGLATVAICGAHATPLPVASESDRARLATDFGYGTLGVPSQNLPLAERPLPDQRYLLCVLLAAPAAAHPVNRAAFAISNNQAASLWFGPSHPNIRGYFAENSGGRFLFRPAAIDGGNGVIGPIQVDTPPADTWQFALETLDPLFNFAKYDLDGDGAVDTGAPSACSCVWGWCAPPDWIEPGAGKPHHKIGKRLARKFVANRIGGVQSLPGWRLHLGFDKMRAA